jgi:hypothetical protein
VAAANGLAGQPDLPSVGSASHKNCNFGHYPAARIAARIAPMRHRLTFSTTAVFAAAALLGQSGLPLARSLLSRPRLGVGRTIPTQALSAIALKRKNGCSQILCRSRRPALFPCRNRVRKLRQQSRRGRRSRRSTTGCRNNAAEHRHRAPPRRRMGPSVIDQLVSASPPSCHGATPRRFHAVARGRALHPQEQHVAPAAPFWALLGRSLNNSGGGCPPLRPPCRSPATA